jgi:hypothetical protein
MSQDKKPSFGFGSKIASIAPNAADAPPPAPPEAEAVAERHGFVARESEQLVRMREPVNAATSQINVRAETTDLNVFLTWCKTERLSYREAFKRIAAAIRKGAI